LDVPTGLSENDDITSEFINSDYILTLASQKKFFIPIN